MRLLWLADALRTAGLTVHEYSGWRTRGLESFGPVLGIVCHGTAGSWTSTDEGELRVIAITGSGTAAAPIAQLYLSRSGAWWVVASGTCTGVKTGTAGPLAGYSDDAVLQIEAQHASSEPWTDVQYRSYVVGVAALVAHGGWPVSNVVGHYEHQPTEKTDPWFDMNRFRADVRAVMSGEEMTPEERIWLFNASSVVGHLAMGSPSAPVYGPDGTLTTLDIARPEVPPAQIDYAKLAEALRPELDAAAKRAVREVLGSLDEVPPGS